MSQNVVFLNTRDKVECRHNMQDTEEAKSPSVVIIGAGPSGYAAAAKLYENSIQNITVLEAEDRIGGRIHSVEFFDTFVDLGAQYCHGEKGNIVYELSQGLDVLGPGVDAIEENIYYSNGSKISHHFKEDLSELILNYEESESKEYPIRGKSIGDVFSYWYNSTLGKKYGRDPNYQQMLKEGLKFCEGSVILTEGTTTWHDSAAESSYETCDGNQATVWKKTGYKAIFDILKKSLLDPTKTIPIDDRIILNSKVEKIIWDQGDKVTIVTTNNNSYEADYVIFTPSVGVLKAQKDSLFQPALPDNKQQAIEALGFSGVIKVIIHFSSQWWKDDDRGFNFFWSEEDLTGIDFPEGPKSNGISWVTQLREISRVLHNPNVWVGWFGGDLVPEIEKLPSEVVKRGLQFVFEKFLNKDYSVSDVDEIICSQWCANENFAGVYSYVKTGRFKEDFTWQDELAEPVKNSRGRPVVLFAGEATNSIHYATVHGAIESGFREAERIVKLCKVYK